MRHVLDRPIWTALSTTHADFSIGAGGARRFIPEIGPLASARDDDVDSLAALTALVRAHGMLVLLQADPVVLPKALSAQTTEAGVQLVADNFVPPPIGSHSIERLGPSDVPEMLALAALTKPGPFAQRTAELGEFWGVKRSGKLTAMAGERMKQPGYTEVSGVCTHPEARGQGLARALSATVAARISARGDTPYLHAYTANTSAIALYQSLGFVLRRPMHVATVELAV